MKTVLKLLIGAALLGGVGFLGHKTYKFYELEEYIASLGPILNKVYIEGQRQAATGIAQYLHKHCGVDGDNIIKVPGSRGQILEYKCTPSI